MKSIVVKISDNPIFETDNFNILGIVLNNKLIIFAIKRYQFIYSEYVFITVYTILIQSKLLYGL